MKPKAICVGILLSIIFTCQPFLGFGLVTTQLFTELKK